MNKLHLNSIIPDHSAKSALLSSARREMYDALKLYHDHVKHTLSLMFAVLTAMFAILGLILKGDVSSFDPHIIRIFGGSVLLLLFPLGIISTFIISRYYELYVAALIYATELHESVGLDSHAWFQEIEEYRSKLGDDVSPHRLLKKRAHGWRHTWFPYTLLIWAIAMPGLVVGLFLLLGSWFWTIALAVLVIAIAVLLTYKVAYKVVH